MKQTLLEKGFSTKEIEVSIELSKELTSKEIAYNFGCSYGAVIFHIKNCIRKLGLKNKHQLLSYLIYLKNTGKELDFVKIESIINKNFENYNVRQNAQN